MLIQDISDYSNGNNNLSSLVKEYLLNYLELIPEIKRVALEFEAYIPSGIRSCLVDLVVRMQEPIRDVFSEVSKSGLIILQQRSETISALEDDLLVQTAVLRVLIKDRLNELAYSGEDNR